MTEEKIDGSEKEQEERGLNEGRESPLFVIKAFTLIGFVSLLPSFYLVYMYFWFFRFFMLPSIDTILEAIIWIVISCNVCVGAYYLAIFVSIGVTNFYLWLINRKTPPRLGSFEHTWDNPDVKAWRKRNIVRKFCVWLTETSRSQWLRKLMLRSFGIKIGKNVRLGKYILEDYFIEIGDNVFMGKNTIVSGHLIDPYKLTLHRTKIGNNVIFDNWTGCVGTTIGDNSIILGKATCGLRGQVAKGGGIYRGTPLRKIADIEIFSPEHIENLKDIIRSQEYLNYQEERIYDIEYNQRALFFYKLIVVLGALAIASIPFYYYTYFIVNVLHFPTWIVWFDLLLISLYPLITLASIFLFVVGVGFITFNILFVYRIILNKGLEEGEYSLSDPRVKAWKTGYLLKLFIMKIVHESPMAFGDVIILQAFRNRIASNVRIVKCFFDPEFIDIGANTECAAFSIIHTHRIKDGKLIIARTKIGENCLIGGFAHIGAGVTIGNNTVVGVGAYVPDGAVLEPNSLYIGNPAKKYPKSMMKKTYEEKSRPVD
ncbi:MAG: DapH/DapD/GlmU-related protein [Candidatus Helarchaeales archaeon]